MSTTDIHKISIRQYLAENNIHPNKDRGYYGMYHSPFRNETDASFKVDFRQNLWFDFGSNEGGSIIDLVMKLENCSLYEAITRLEQKSNSFSFHRTKDESEQQRINIRISKVLPLENTALVQYLNERKLNIDTARKHCREIHYTVGDKPYFAVGFENNSGGYELRNKYFKGCTSKDVTTVDNGADTCLVFEGFLDYLSFLTLKGIKEPQHDVAVLNSVANLQKALDFIASHKGVYAYLDNDEAGRQATQTLKSACESLSDQSENYRQHKDLNEFLCSRNRGKIQHPRKGLRR